MLPFSDLVARYLRFREIGKKLNSVLVRQLPTDALEEAGRELGLLHKGIFVFNSEDESAILMDYCLYNVLRQGRNAIQSLLAHNPPPEESDELLVLQGMSKAWYSLFGVVAVEPGAGVRVQDILRQTEHLLLDIGLSRSAVPGGLMASRLIPLDGFIMTTGAGLPLSGGIARRDTLIGQLTKVLFAKNIRSFELLTPQQEKELARTIIATALSWGASSQIRYQDAGEQENHPQEGYSQPQPLVPIQTGGRVGRNEPCPCGSGKKFKKCCAKH